MLRNTFTGARGVQVPETQVPRSTGARKHVAQKHRCPETQVGQKVFIPATVRMPNTRDGGLNIAQGDDRGQLFWTLTYPGRAPPHLHRMEIWRLEDEAGDDVLGRDRRVRRNDPL